MLMLSKIVSYPLQLMRDISELLQHAKVIGWGAAIAKVAAPTASASWQFTKYLVIGGSSVVVFYLSYGLFRFLVEQFQPRAFTEARLLWNMIAIAVAFIPTNFFTYNTNCRWVFVRGKHSAHKEFWLFTAAAAFSLVAGQWLAWFFISFTLVNDLMVTMGVIILSTLVNFLFRKLVVF
jgi:putative flippase GtrA